MREWHDVGVYVEPTSCAIQSFLANLAEHLQSPAFAALARHRTRHLAAPSQRALGLYLPGNEVMLHVSVGPESEGERQMLFDQLDLGFEVQRNGKPG